MSTIRGYSQSNYYDSADNDYSAYNQNASSFLAGLSINSGAGNNNGIMVVNPNGSFDVRA